MTLLDVITLVRDASLEELPAVKAELAAAVAMVDARLSLAPAPAHATPVQPKDEPDFTPQDVAGILGIHPKTVYGWCLRVVDPIPSVLYGRARRIPQKPFREWKARQVSR